MVVVKMMMMVVVVVAIDSCAQVSAGRGVLVGIGGRRREA